MVNRFTIFLLCTLLAVPLSTRARATMLQLTDDDTGQSFDIPYTDDFSNESTFSNYIVKDLDGDGNTWRYDADGQTAQCYYGDNDNYQNNDWLLTPLLNLKAGVNYTLSCKFTGDEWAFTTYSGGYSIAYGQGDDPTSYTTLVEYTDIDNDDEGGVVRTPKVTFSVPSDGQYRIGFRCANDGARSNWELTLHLDDISVTGAAGVAPDSVTNLRVIPDGNNLRATIAFNAPTINTNGEALSSITKIEVWRGETLVGTVSNPSPGSEQSVVDESPEAGMNTYRVVAYNDDGEGRASTISAFIGADTPSKATDAKLDRKSDGAVSLSWTAPSIGKNGGYIDPSTLTYKITRYPDSTVVAENQSGTTFTENITTPGVYHYGIQAINGSAVGDSVATNEVFFGTPYATPYVETFDSTAGNYTFYDADKDGYTWRYSKQGQALTNDYPWFNNCDDWAISPLIHLDGNWRYTLSFSVSGSGTGHPQELSVAYGPGINPTEYTSIMDKFTFDSDNQYIGKSKNFNVENDGNYQVGFHLTSGGLMWGAWLDNVKVEKLVRLDSPDSVTAISITPAAQAAHSATVAFTTPTITTGQQTLSSLTKVEVYRDSLLVNTFDSPAVGTRLSFTDNGMDAGFHTYTIVPYNENGNGMANADTAWIGEDVPFAPTDVTATDNFNGTVTVNWTAPATQGVNGGYVNSPALKYNIYMVEGSNESPSYTFQKTVTGTTADVDISQTGSQYEVRYAVTAVTEGGEGQASTSDLIVVGGSYNLPFTESFTAGGMKNTWWNKYDQSYILAGSSNYATSDNDGGSYMYAQPYGSYEPVKGTLTSGKIRIEGSTNPQLTFSYLASSDDLTKTSIKVYAIRPDNSKVELDVPDLNNATDWRSDSISLSQLANEKYIRLQFEFTTEAANTYLYLDNIKLRDLLEYNLAATSINAPFKTAAGQSFDVNVTIENQGLNKIEDDDYTVDLYVDGKLSLSAPGEAIEPDASKTFTFTVPSSINDTEAKSIYATLTCLYDLKDEDNTTSTVSVAIQEPGLPTVDDLTGDNGTLTWSAPKSKSRTIYEDFENYEHGIIDNIGPWTVYDADKRITVADYMCTPEAGANLPNYDQPMAFQVWNPEKMGLNLDYNPGTVAHSGSQSIVSWGGYDPDNYQVLGHNDYLISPELSGEAQQVTLWAKSLSGDYPESFWVLGSTDGNDYTDFDTSAPLLSSEETPDTWTQFTVDIPEGTKYFAIYAANSFASFETMFDDIVYHVTAPAIKGYNIYRDGEKIATVGSEQTSWTDPDLNANHVYNVTVIYDDNDAESAYSNDATLTTGISALGSGSLTIDGNVGQIDITGAEGLQVTIVTTDGATLFNGEGENQLSIPAKRGLYIVKAGKTVRKVTVK